MEDEVEGRPGVVQFWTGNDGGFKCLKCQTRARARWHAVIEDCYKSRSSIFDEVPSFSGEHLHLYCECGFQWAAETAEQMAMRGNAAPGFGHS